MATLVLIAMKRRVLCDYWHLVLETAKFETVSCWTTLEEALQQVGQRKPDLLLIESSFGDRQGLETARQAMIIHPSLRCAVCMSATDGYFQQALQTDISGFLTEDIDEPDEVLLCLNRISKHYRYSSAVFQTAFYPPIFKQKVLVGNLTTRRKQVLRLMAKGHTCRQIAYELKLAEPTVRHLKEQISRAVGLDGVFQLKAFAGSVAYLLE